MATNDPDLTLRINANANQAKKELKTTEKALDGLKDKANQTYGALAAAISTAGLSMWIASSLEAASNLEFLARRSNATIEEFQRLAVGARMVGVENETLATIFQDVNDKVGDFMQTDGGELADFFKGIAPQIGVTADQFKNLSGPQALQLFVSSLEKANTSQADMIFYLESIASDASLLLPMLRNNGEGFKRWADEAERLGLILSTETVRAVSDYKAQTELTSIATENLGTKIGVEMIPALSNLNGLLLDLASDQKVAEIASGILGTALTGLAWVVLGLGEGFTSLGIRIGGFAAAASAAFAGNFAGAKQILEEVDKDIIALVEKNEKRMDQLLFGGFSEAGKKAADLNNQVRTAQDKANASTEKAATLTAFQRQEVQKLEDDLGKESDKLKDLSKSQEIINELKKLKIDLDSKEAKALIEKAKQYEKDEKANEAKEEAEKAAEQAAADRQSQAEQLAQQQQSYVQSLERQAATLGMNTQQLRIYELAEQSLTGTLKQRAEASIAAIAAFEKQQQAIENADTNAGLESDYLTAIGRETDAAMLEIDTKYKRLLRDFEKTGNETGKAWADKLIDVEKVKARLDAVQSETDKTLASIGRAESRINVELEAGLITQTEAQQKLLNLRVQEANALEQQIPVLREIIAQGGVAGEQAQAQLDEYQTRIIEIRNTATDLQKALKDGLTSGIQEALSGLADGTMKLRDAISALGLSVADALFNMASQKLADQLWSSVSSLFNTGSKTATDTAGAVAYSTAISTASSVGSAGYATAIGTSSTAGATAIGTAITSAGAAAAAAISAAIASSSAASGSSSGLGGMFSGLMSGMGGSGGGSGGGFFSSLGSFFGGGSGGAGGGGGSEGDLVTQLAMMYATGGMAATGGKVVGPGTGTSDSIPMWLSNEEFVVQSASVKQPGAEAFLHDFNRLGMGALDRYHQATGGLAGIPAPVLPAPALSSIKLAEPTPASVTLKNSQQFNLIDDPQRIASVMSGRQGIESIAVALSSDPARFRSLLELT